MQDAIREQYKPDPAFNIVYTGFRNGENESVIATLASANPNADILTAPGTYSIDGYGGFDGNYAFSYVSGNLTVLPPTIPPPPVPPSSSIPNTVIAGPVSNVAVNTGQAQEKAHPAVQSIDTFDLMEKETSSTALDMSNIIVIPDNDVVSSQKNGLYFLIAITEQLERFFGYESNKE